MPHHCGRQWSDILYAVAKIFAAVRGDADNLAAPKTRLKHGKFTHQRRILRDALRHPVQRVNDGVASYKDTIVGNCLRA
jgi:hypothetical protein